MDKFVENIREKFPGILLHSIDITTNQTGLWYFRYRIKYSTPSSDRCKAVVRNPKKSFGEIRNLVRLRQKSLCKLRNLVRQILKWPLTFIGKIHHFRRSMQEEQRRMWTHMYIRSVWMQMRQGMDIGCWSKNVHPGYVFYAFRKFIRGFYVYLLMFDNKLSKSNYGLRTDLCVFHLNLSKFALLFFNSKCPWFSFRGVNNSRKNPVHF